MAAVVIDISAAKALGYRPGYDLESGMATVWPEFDPANPLDATTLEGEARRA
jgi:UDP-glucose 4-epimerase